jgi:carboxyl-terminal processing protease
MKNIVVLIVIFFSYIQTSYTQENYNPDQERNFVKLNDAFNLYSDFLRNVYFNYAVKIDPEKLTYYAIQGALKDLDPFSFIYKKQNNKFLDDIYLKDFFGYGLNFDTLNSKVYIVKVMQNSSAMKAGIQVGDIVKKVNGRDIDGSKNFLLQILDSNKTDEITLEVYRGCNDSTIDFALKKSKVVNEPILLTQIPNTHIFYLSFDTFFNNLTLDLQKKFSEVDTTQMKSLIIDLRGNPGGLMNEALGMLNLFISDNKPVCSIIGQKNETIEEFNLPDKAMFPKLPIMILVDKETASSSEIFSAIMQEYDRAVIIGEPTLGKGLVQNTFPLRNDYEMRLTTGRYLTSNGRWIQHFAFANKFYQDKTDSTKIFYSKSGKELHQKKAIEPDIIMPTNDFSPLVQDLVNSKTFFLYLNTLNCNYISNNNSNELTDPLDFNSFLKFLDSNNYYDNTDLIKQLKDLQNLQMEYGENINDFDNNRDTVGVSFGAEYDKIFKQEQNQKIEYIKSKLIENKDLISDLIHLFALSRNGSKSNFIAEFSKYDNVIKKAVELLQKQNKN